MSIESKKSVIGDTTYELVTLGTKDGQKVLLRLIRILGPSAVEILTKGSKGIVQALSMATSSIGDSDLDFITEIFAGKCTVYLQGKNQVGQILVPTKLDLIYDSHFAGRWDEWALWLGWCVNENFTSFFGGKAIEKIAAKWTEMVSQSNYQKE